MLKKSGVQLDDAFTFQLLGSCIYIYRVKLKYACKVLPIKVIRRHSMRARSYLIVVGLGAGTLF